MIYLVCINRDQPDSILPMLDATRSFGDNRVVVLDRSPDIAGTGFPHIVRNDKGDGFLAGRMRDLGREYVERLDPEYTGILFVDGDRIPQEDLLPHCFGDVMLFSSEEDQRGDLQGITNVTEACTQIDSPFFSLAVYLSRKVIDSVKEEGRLFAPCFDGFWGDEDRDLGDRIAQAGFTVTASPKRVSGQWVDRYSQGMDKRNFALRIARRKARFNDKHNEVDMTIQELFDKAKKATQTAESAQAMASESVLATVEILCNAIAERDKKIAELQAEISSLKIGDETPLVEGT